MNADANLVQSTSLKSPQEMPIPNIFVPDPTRIYDRSPVVNPDANNLNHLPFALGKPQTPGGVKPSPGEAGGLYTDHPDDDAAMKELPKKKVRPWPP